MGKGGTQDVLIFLRSPYHQSHLSRLLLEVDLPAVRVEAVAEGVERQDQVETRTDKCLKW